MLNLNELNVSIIQQNKPTKKNNTYNEANYNAINISNMRNSKSLECLSGYNKLLVNKIAFSGQHSKLDSWDDVTIESPQRTREPRQTKERLNSWGDAPVTSSQKTKRTTKKEDRYFNDTESSIRKSKRSQKDEKILDDLIKGEKNRRAWNRFKFGAMATLLAGVLGFPTAYVASRYEDFEPYIDMLRTEECLDKNVRQVMTGGDLNDFYVKVPDGLREEIQNVPEIANEIQDGQVCITRGQLENLRREIELRGQIDSYLTITNREMDTFNEILNSDYGVIRLIDRENGNTRVMLGRLDREVQINDQVIPKDRWFIISYTSTGEGDIGKKAEIMSYIDTNIPPERLEYLQSQMNNGENAAAFIENFETNIVEASGNDSNETILNEAQAIKSMIREVISNYERGSESVAVSMPNEFWNEVLRIDQQEMSVIDSLATASRNQLPPLVGETINLLSGVDGFFFVNNGENSNMVVIKLNRPDFPFKYAVIQTHESVSRQEQQNFDIRNLPNLMPESVNLVGRDGSFVEFSREAMLSSLADYNNACGTTQIYNNAPGLLRSIATNLSGNTCYDPFDVAYRFKTDISEMADTAIETNGANARGLNITRDGILTQQLELPETSTNEFLTESEMRELGNVFVDKSRISLKGSQNRDILTLERRKNEYNRNEYTFSTDITGNGDLITGTITADGVITVIPREESQRNLIQNARRFFSGEAEQENREAELNMETINRRLRILIENMKQEGQPDIDIVWQR